MREGVILRKAKQFSVAETSLSHSNGAGRGDRLDSSIGRRGK